MERKPLRNKNIILSVHDEHKPRRHLSILPPFVLRCLFFVSHS
nr:MAG TPA: hypothetical protein [Caudoviricetes sp.]